MSIKYWRKLWKSFLGGLRNLRKLGRRRAGTPPARSSRSLDSRSNTTGRDGRELPQRRIADRFYASRQGREDVLMPPLHRRGIRPPAADAERQFHGPGGHDHLQPRRQRENRRLPSGFGTHEENSFCKTGDDLGNNGCERDPLCKGSEFAISLHQR